MVDLTQEHLQLKESTRKFTDKEIVPIAAELDRNEADIPDDVYRKMAEMGYFGILTPVEYDGCGWDHVSLAIVTEELCRGWLSVGSLISRNITISEMLLAVGTQMQKDRWLRDLAAGKIQSASAGTEPEAGSDAANVKMRAVKSGKEWILNGTKMFCTNAHKADLLFVLVRTDPDAKPKNRGISAICVPKKPGENFAPPQIVGHSISTVGYHGMKTYELVFEDCRVPEDHLIGSVNAGFLLLMQGYETARIQFAARSVGLAQAAFEAALKYSRERVQFDRPISKFQAVRFKLADMATAIEIARQFNYYAAAKKASGVRCDLEAGMSKLYASEMAMKVTWDALQIHGGYGYTKEFPLERYWRDAGLLPIGEGTSEIQREVIARRIIGS